MALHAETAWEIRTTGAAVNGGGFYNRDPGTSVDYTEQDAAQQSWTNLSTDAAGTTLTDADAGGNFTAAMVGNIIHITAGTGFTVGYYEIIAFTDGDNVTIDASAGANATAGTGAVGGALSEIDDLKITSWRFAQGNTIWVKAGTYNLSAHLVINYGGTTSIRSTLSGYNSSRGDNPIGNDRPLIQGGATYYSEMANYQLTENLRFESSYGSGTLRLGMYSYTRNCYVSNTTASANLFAIQHFSARPGCSIVDCEVTCPNGYGVQASQSADLLVHGCYIHDCKYGLNLDNTSHVAFTILDACSTYGIRVNGTGGSIVNCVFYNCGVGIDGLTYYSWHVHNCIINACATGIQRSAMDVTWHLNYNNWFGNTADVSNVIKGDQATAVDPKFTDAPGGDFSLQGDSQCIGAGLAIRAGV